MSEIFTDEHMDRFKALSQKNLQTPLENEEYVELMDLDKARRVFFEARAKEISEIRERAKRWRIMPTDLFPDIGPMKEIRAVRQSSVSSEKRHKSSAQVRPSESNDVLIEIKSNKGPSFTYKRGRVYECYMVGKEGGPPWAMNKDQFPKALREATNLEKHFTLAGEEFFASSDGQSELSRIKAQIESIREWMRKKAVEQQ